jgi:hypothetical protein
MLDEYRSLVDANERLKECKEIASSRDSVAKLQEWLSKEAPKTSYGNTELFSTISRHSQDEVNGLLLPEAGTSTGKFGGELTGP